MGTTIEDISSTKKRLKIEIPSDVIEKEYQTSLASVRQKAKIPGFRPGKVPANIIEKRYGNDIKADIIDRLVPEYYSRALKDADLTPVTMPTLEGSVDIKRNEPLSFSLTVEVRPPIANMNYAGLKVDEIPVKVEDDEVEETLRSMQEERAVFDVVDRDIREDDLIVVDYVKFDPTGEKELSSATDQVMNLGNRITPPGVLDSLLGKKKGDVVDINLPSFAAGADVPEAQEEGKDGDRIRVTIKEVKEKRLPAMDDEFGKDLGYDTLDALRARIRESLDQAKQNGAAKKQKEQLLNMLLESHDIDIPEILLEEELHKLVINEKASGKGARDLVDESGEKKAGGDAGDDSELRERLRPAAERNVKTTLLLDAIGDAEKVTVSEEEMKTRIVALAQHLRTTPDVVINLFKTKDGSLDGLAHSIREEKVLDAVLSKAVIEKGGES